MSSSQDKKTILVIGGTGAQGSAVINALLALTAHGEPSSFVIRVLTRDPDDARARKLAEMPGVELFKGSMTNLSEVEGALQGVYGAFVNTDGFTIGEQAELYYGVRIFEIAKQSKTVRHLVWSNLDYALKKGGYNPAYKCDHYDAKGRVAEWIKAQPSETDGGMIWSVLTSGPYMDMLYHLFAPVGQRADGTHVFAAPIQDGHVPMIALTDLGFFARHIFDNPRDASGLDFEIASELVSWPYLIETFTRVTGQKAIFVRQSLDEYFATFTEPDRPVAKDVTGAGATTFRKNFSGFWSLWRDGVISRDMAWIKRVHPGAISLEEWMKREGYTGARKALLKGADGRESSGLREDKIAQLLAM